MIEKRHTNRRDFSDQDVPPDVIYELINAAEQEEASLVEITTPEHKVVAAQLSREAEAIQNIDPGYQAELQAWTTTALRRPDGVPVSAIPRTESRFERLRCFWKGMAAAAEAVQPQPLPHGARNDEIYPLDVVASRRGVAAHFAGSHPVGVYGQPGQPGG